LLSNDKKRKSVAKSRGAKKGVITSQAIFGKGDLEKRNLLKLFQILQGDHGREEEFFRKIVPPSRWEKRGDVEERKSRDVH